MKKLNLYLLYLLLISVLIMTMSAIVVNGALWQGEDYYYYSGGKLTAKAGNSADVQYTTYLDYSLQGGCEISFKLDFPNTTFSEGVFFGIYSIKDPTQRCMTQSARITFSLSSKSFSLYKNGNRSALLDPSDWIDYSRFTNAGYTMQGENLFRMTVTPEGETKLYLKSMLSGAQEIQVGYYKKLFSQEIVNDCWFGYSMYLKGFDWHMSDIMIKDAASQIVFADDFSLLESTHYIYGSQIAALISNGNYVITQGTQKKYLDIDLSAVPVNAVKGSVTDFTPVTAGSGVLTISAVPEQGETINITADGEGRFKYAFQNEGVYTLNYTYTDTDDSTNFISKSLQFNVALPEISVDVSSVPNSGNAGEQIDLTPVVTGQGEYSLSVAVKDNEGNTIAQLTPQGDAYLYTFESMGVFSVEYSIDGDLQKSVAINILPVITPINLRRAYTEDEYDLTPQIIGLTQTAAVEVSVSSDGVNFSDVSVSEGKYQYTFSEKGYYSVRYQVKEDDTVVAEIMLTDLRVEDQPIGSFLTLKNDVSYTLSNNMSYVNIPLNGGTIVEFEVRLGATANEFLALGLYPSNSSSVFTNNGYRSVQLGGYNLRSFSKIDNQTIKTVLAKEDCAYSDAYGEYNFYNRMSVKLVFLKNGDVDVYVKCTEDEDLFKGNADIETLREYIKIETFEGWYGDLIGAGNYYFGWGLATNPQTEDVDFYKIVIRDLYGNLIFADNFTQYNTQSEKYVITGNAGAASNSVKEALIRDKLYLYLGEPLLIPYINTSDVPSLVFTGEEVDVTASLVNFADQSELEAVVQDADDNIIEPAEGLKYVFTKQGIYKVSYQAEDNNEAVNSVLFITVINEATQKSAEENFDSGKFNSDYWDYVASAVKDGRLHIYSNSTDKAYFTTKNAASYFILTFDLLGIKEGTDSFSIIFGGDSDIQYSINFESGSETITFIYTDGSTIEKNIGIDVFNALSSTGRVTFRIKVLGSKANLYITSASQSYELLEIPIAEFDSILFTGRVGVVTENENGVIIDNVQFVSLVTVKEDNTTDTVPEEPIVTPTPSPQPSAENGCSCKGYQSGKIIFLLLFMAAAIVFNNFRAKQK
jgi:hypothetical protein